MRLALDPAPDPAPPALPPIGTRLKPDHAPHADVITPMSPPPLWGQALYHALRSGARPRLSHAPTFQVRPGHALHGPAPRRSRPRPLGFSWPVPWSPRSPRAPVSPRPRLRPAGWRSGRVPGSGARALPLPRESGRLTSRGGGAAAGLGLGMGRRTRGWVGVGVGRRRRAGSGWRWTGALRKDVRRAAGGCAGAGSSWRSRGSGWSPRSGLDTWVRGWSGGGARLRVRGAGCAWLRGAEGHSLMCGLRKARRVESEVGAGAKWETESPGETAVPAQLRARSAARGAPAS